MFVIGENRFEVEFEADERFLGTEFRVNVFFGPVSNDEEKGAKALLFGVVLLLIEFLLKVNDLFFGKEPEKRKEIDFHVHAP